MDYNTLIIFNIVLSVIILLLILLVFGILIDMRDETGRIYKR